MSSKNTTLNLVLGRKGLGDGIAASASITAENNWAPEVSVSTHLNCEELGVITAHEFFMVGMAVETAQKARELALAEGLTVDRIDVTVQYSKSWIVTVPSVDLGGGMRAIGDGYSKYSHIIRVKTGIPSEDLKSFKLKMGMISLQIKAFNMNQGPVNIELID